MGDQPTPRTRDFEYEGHRLVYDEYGEGERVVVLLPGLLFPRRMHAPLAGTLAARGHRVICHNRDPIHPFSDSDSKAVRSAGSLSRRGSG